MNNNIIETQARIAEYHFLLKSTVPILIEELRNGQLAMGIQGHGTPFIFLDRLFIITARHVFEDIIDWDCVGIPTKPDPGKSILWPLFAEQVEALTLFKADTHLASHKTDGIDIGIIEIMDDNLANIIRSNYHIHTSSSLLSRRSRYINLNILATPRTLAKPNSKLLTISPHRIYIETIPLDDVPIAEPGDETIPSIFDVHLQYGRNAFDQGGNHVDAPELGGISGCGIWARTPEIGSITSTPWTVPMKLYLVDTSYRAGQNITGQRVCALISAFEKIDKRISSEIKEAIDR